ncbi:MAG: zinc metallopeptidase [Alphaproteobacteria bacterium]|jgi:predicted metalloprotease|nr:zinc metallopeptidase [Alphaproteobacteria bacterium]MBU1561684.1 zinc metallopeptidase [Alphaproteobacteria bacterium]MBU2301272.1 zinc metallopeptidase [Alphaproteobacteria bacterium]MBU2366633.1 zinc metallopeptidase [Alphaproteobacteria bacterium]
MKWRGRQQSSNIEDRRGQGGGGLGGLGGSSFGRGGGFRLPTGGGGGSRGGIGSLIGIVVVLGIIWFATGQNPIDILTGGSSTSGSSASSSGQLPTTGEEAELRDFVGVVVKETEDLWTEVFQASGEDYPEPTVVLFTGAVDTACGAADSSAGPFYCPGDSRVYIDLSFYDQLHQQFGAPGDFAQAYVLAHEVGHHIQNITGVLPEFNQRRASMSQEEANAYSVRVELQADCYAGVWANYAGQEDLLDSGDIEEALNAASQIGDDTLQKRMQGFAVPKTFNHGTSAQRKTWFERGYTSGNPGDCDTFSGNV